MNPILWRPDAARVASTNLTRFIGYVNARHALRIAEYRELHAWSVADAPAFWTAVWDFCGIRAQTRGERVVADPARMPGARWFPEARLNFAENLLRRRDDSTALRFRDERGHTRGMTWRALYAEVQRVAEALRGYGVVAGDRVAGITANTPEAIIAMLATASLGAVWSSCSPDFGTQGVLDRFDQIAPKVMFAMDGYYYAGKTLDIRDKVAEIRAALPGLERLVVIPFIAAGDLPGADRFDTLGTSQPDADIRFEAVPFNHPLYILYSSGTTGKPKCIVHGAGGTLIQHLKEHQLHSDIRPGDRLFYFTTCGWMMWNWLVSGLASEATLLLYDGSPFHPDGYTLFDYADREDCTQFGISAKFVQGIEKFDVRPRERHALKDVRTILSTGSVLPPEGFDYVYTHVKQDVCLSSVSGGTDIISCFIGGNPNGPVYRGELQCKGLGMATQVFDELGRPVIGEKGELVCTNAFPSMPIGFWGDADGSRYRAAYFERFPNVWAHGDFAEETPHGGFVIHGRSDATLNPGGVRIGTAEIYRQVETLEEVVECVAIGQEWDGDVRVVLFVVLRAGEALTGELERRLRDRIRTGASPRHVPARIVQVSDIPRTRSGKLTELAIRDVVHGRTIRNVEALSNPEALEQFRNRPELAA
ncbi:MAG: acetoacetate--CoA ligase [Gammaproteobacteria bacterium]